MYLVILNAIVYVIFFLVYIKFYKSFDAGFILVALYTLVAVLGVFAYEMLQTDSFFSQFNFTDITFFPYLFLFIIVFMFLSPILGFGNRLLKKPVIYKESRLMIFSYIYIFCAFISCYLLYKIVVGYWVNQEWGQIRVDHYAGESKLAYSSVFERIFLSFTMYFRIPATIVFFALLSKKDKKHNLLFFILFFLCIIFPVIGDSMRTASRGMIITLFIEIALCYTFFQNNISVKLKKLLLFSSVFIVFLAFLYSMAITNSRFGEGDEAFSSLICYWGQPPIVFNSSVSAINSFFGGSFFFHPLLEFFGYKSSLSPTLLGGNWGPTFMTFVGSLYIDFSPVGVVVIAIIIPFFMKIYIKKQRYFSINSLYLILFYCSYLQDGALVTGSGFVYDIFVATIIFQLLKYFNPASNEKLSIIKTFNTKNQ